MTATCSTGNSLAQQGWNPFSEPGLPGAAPRRQGKSTTETPLAPPAATDAGRGPGGLQADGPLGDFSPRETVERSDLPPMEAGVVAPPQRPVAPENRADSSALVKLAAELELPMRSPALTQLLIAIVGPRGALADRSDEGLGTRSALLYRAGRLAEANDVAGEWTAGPGIGGTAGAVMAALQARTALAFGDRERACAASAALVQSGAHLPASITTQGVVIQGYCGAAAGNPAAAGLAASLAREQKGVPESVLGALDAVAAGEQAAFDGKGRIGIIEWRLAEIGGKTGWAMNSIDRFELDAVVAVAHSESAAPVLRILAAEAAARANAIDGPRLADAYRRHLFAATDLAAGTSARVEPGARRAFLYKAAEAERTPFKRTRLVRAALDDARRAGLYWQVAVALESVVAEIRPVPEVGWFAETAVEVMLLAGRLEEARRWARLGSEAGGQQDRAVQSLAHWLALIDIVDPDHRVGRGQSLASVEEIALRGRFSTEGLHRLATVLDALDYHVPMRLWEAASRAPQPTTGHLPATGVLSELLEASKRKDLARILPLVVRALGKDGAEGAHMIALGDSIRALKRAGLDREARLIALEALFGLWPRASST